MSKLRTARRIASVIGWVAVFGAIAALLIPTLLGYDRYVIVSGSMSGTVERGGVVFEKAVDVKDLKVGDVITYTPPPAAAINHLVTHRISEIGVGEDGQTVYRTKGDANPGQDPWKFTLNGDKQNVMKFSVPFVGYPLLYLANASARLILIGVAAAIIGLMALYDLIVDQLAYRKAVRALQATTN